MGWFNPTVLVGRIGLVEMFSLGHGLCLGLSLVGWVGFGLLSCVMGWLLVACKNMGFIYFYSEKYAHSPPVIQPPPMFTTHTDREMFMVICELIDKLSRSLGGDHDGIHNTISDRLNKVIVGFNN